MSDISGFGLQVLVVASETFPVGFTVNQFADDSDPFDIPSVTVAETAMGVNGDLIGWKKAVPVKINLSVIPNSEDDQNLSILLDANRPTRGKFIVDDQITITAIYPDGSSISLTGGKITDGMPSSSVASAGRLKSKTYGFSFEDANRTF